MTLKELRIKSGFTQAQVAKKMDVQQSTVSRWDEGSTPSKPYRRKLAKLYGCTVAELLTSAKEAAI